MLTANEYRTLPSAVASVRERLLDYLGGMRPENFSTLDEPYRLLAKRAYTLKRFGTVRPPYLTDRSIFDYEHLEEFFSSLLDISTVNHATIPELYDAVQGIADSILSSTESVNERLQLAAGLVKTAEGVLKRNTNATSVKDEDTVYDTLTSRGFIRAMDTTLTLNLQAGVLSLPVLSAESVPYEILSLGCNKPKGTVSRSIYGKDTLFCFTMGYFSDRTFSSSPRIESDHTQVTNPPALYDDSLESSYVLDYNSFSPDDELRLNLRLSLATGKIDAVSITADPGTMDYLVASEEMLLPVLSTLKVGDDRLLTDMLPVATDNRIWLRDTQAGSIENRVRHGADDLYPTTVFPVYAQAVSRVNLELRAGTPQLAFYPEKVLLGDGGEVSHRYNYLETLALDGYTAPEGYLDPASCLSTEQLRAIQSKMAAAPSWRNERVPIYRYSMGIKDLKLYRYNYEKEGIAVTIDLNRSGRRLAAVELFVNELIPENCSIQYYVSADLLSWTEIVPGSRSAEPKRIVFRGFDASSIDAIIDEEATSLYLKIIMRGTSGESPLLKAYAVRLKHL